MLIVTQMNKTAIQRIDPLSKESYKLENRGEIKKNVSERKMLA